MYKLKSHKNLTPERWKNFSLAQQILMIANEINRAKNCLHKGYVNEAKNSYERAFELLDLTISTTEKYNLIRELLRFREILALQYIKRKKEKRISEKLLSTLISLNGEAYRLLNQETHQTHKAL
ncbi:MAG: hypothetical protein QW156_04150 [Candidatus Aenigmatarchaeota archaeon]